jgi:hypothetical protein
LFPEAAFRLQFNVGASNEDVIYYVSTGAPYGNDFRNALHTFLPPNHSVFLSDIPVHFSKKQA